MVNVGKYTRHDMDPMGYEFPCCIYNVGTYTIVPIIDPIIETWGEKSWDHPPSVTRATILGQNGKV